MFGGYLCFSVHLKSCVCVYASAHMCVYEHIVKKNYFKKIKENGDPSFTLTYTFYLGYLPLTVLALLIPKPVSYSCELNRKNK